MLEVVSLAETKDVFEEAKQAMDVFSEAKNSIICRGYYNFCNPDVLHKTGAGRQLDELVSNSS